MTVYDAAENTVYRYTPKQQSSTSTGGDREHGEAPSVAKIEEGIAKLREHVNLSEAVPANIGGQPAYTVRVSPQEGGSLIGGGELSFDAHTGVPLRAAVYSSTGSAPVVELAAGEVSYGPVSDSVFQLSPPPGSKVKTLELEKHGHQSKASSSSNEAPEVTTHGSGITSVEVLKAKEGNSSGASSGLESLPKVKLPNGVSASELRTALGTVLTFERAGSRYVVAGALDPAAVEAVAGSF